MIEKCPGNVEPAAWADPPQCGATLERDGIEHRCNRPASHRGPHTCGEQCTRLQTWP